MLTGMALSPCRFLTTLAYTASNILAYRCSTQPPKLRILFPVIISNACHVALNLNLPYVSSNRPTWPHKPRAPIQALQSPSDTKPETVEYSVHSEQNHALHGTYSEWKL